ncbi:MAG TPA: DUF1501 domain-containing protein [Acidobacteriota bacterium]|nr:DUF1501 domain-containing protein [Acidobacteriota bacterium]HNB70031.1 DUF1501 domain-containing protein [Acidobacteriota bacterium]HNJ39460.1 DUF1501 domain-containing protein [Acidobacteriota bacterium]
MFSKHINRRNFLKQGFGFVTAGVVLPHLGLSGFAQTPSFAPSDRRILVVIEFAGGNDGLNTVIPYTDPAYLKARPTIGLTDKDGILSISDRYALHPELAELKPFYDAGNVAIVQSVGYPEATLSHFRSRDIWHTADPVKISGEGWLGKAAEQLYGSNVGLKALSVGNGLPKTLQSPVAVVPAIVKFPRYDYQTDSRYAADGKNQEKTFTNIYGQTRTKGTLDQSIAMIGLDALEGADTLQAGIAQYQSNVQYPANNPLSEGLKMLAQIITTIPESQILYVTLGGFDNHSQQIAAADQKLSGDHATLLKYFSEGVDAFYKDLAGHGLAEQVVVMQWSEFGRRPNENGSLGTDHGTASSLFVIGNPVKGGIYGNHPNLTSLDRAGNVTFDIDFRSVYGTILDGWLKVSSSQVLGATFENIGFF